MDAAASEDTRSPARSTFASLTATMILIIGVVLLGFAGGSFPCALILLTIASCLSLIVITECALAACKVVRGSVIGNYHPQIGRAHV